MVGLRQASRQSGVPVSGDSGKTYKVKYHPEARRFSCSCRDWTYAKSHKRRGPGGDCKHIGKMKSGVKQQLMEKTATAVRGRAAQALLKG